MTFLLLTALTAWTNTAARVVWAEPVRLDGANVIMDCGAAGIREFPLTVFPGSERRRIRAALGAYELPAELGRLRAAFAADLTRAEQRHAGGAMTDEAFAAKRARVNAAWRAALDRARLTSAEVAYWKGHLR